MFLVTKYREDADLVSIIIIIIIIILITIIIIIIIIRQIRYSRSSRKRPHDETIDSDRSQVTNQTGFHNAGRY